MKIAIASEGNTLTSVVDSRFGRCEWFLLYDTETKEQNFMANPAAQTQEGAGPSAVKFVASQGVKRIVAGEFGAKIRPLLEELGIEMISNKEPGRLVGEVIGMLNL